MEHRIDDVRIIIQQGDITEADVEAVVNAANNRMYMGAGVAGAIRKKGGQQIEDEAVQKGPIEIGGALLTSAGVLKTKWIIHAAVMGIDGITDAEKIRSATLSALKVADENSIQSIAFPALGTGVGGFPFNEAARVMFKIVKEYLNTNESFIKEIVFVLFGYEAYNEFLNRAEKDLEKVIA
ncbi:MAG: macro domain-containing protein [Candidatus Aquicultor sp.]